MNICLIVNADPGGVDSLRPGVERLRKQGHQVRPRITFEAGDARRIARYAAEGGADLVIAAGGDGTINEVVNGLHDYAARCGADCCPRMGIVALGTANDLAGALGIPENSDRALEVAVHGEVVHADVGVINDRCFINVSTGGFGAEATDQTPDEVKRALGPLAYLITGMQKFATLEVSRARFVADEVIYDGPFLIFAVGNSWRTGGGNRLTPHAELDDGQLDLCVVREMSRMDFVRLLPNLRNGSHLDHPAVIYRRVRQVTVAAADELTVNADGESMVAHRFDYSISPYRIPIAVPAPGAVGPPG